MPYLKIETSAKTSEEIRHKLCELLSKTVAVEIGKPETYVMVTVNASTMSMAGKSDPCAFVDIRSIGGLNGKVNKALAKAVCKIIEEKLGIPGNRVYLNFSDVSAANWGVDGSTFG